MEASEERRKKYKEEIDQIPVQDRVYIDESGIEMTICKDRGWSKRGEKINDKKSGKYYNRTNIIAGLINNKPIAPGLFNGSCDTKCFEIWVEHSLIKELRPGQVVVMDNATFHKSQKTIELIESVDCRVIFLPPYSPDLNPIEKFWANMKRWIRSKVSQFDKLYDAIAAYFNAQTST